MKKLILSLAVVAIATFSAKAQDSKKSDSKDLKFSVGVEAGVPVGDLGNISTFAIGGSVQGEYMVDPSIGVTLNAGYLNFMAKDGFPSSGLIPVLVGGRYYFNESWYGSVQVGMSFSTESGGGSAFTYAPGIGYKVSENFDILAKYQAASKDGGTSAFAGIRAAYSF
ncbi:outer membrane beta-barrel protein [Ferruginibacter albus]|uniref:outer membrane beta-barrel protein n=1 Tax=Ferruginibacter albus TaxID=2875540 RepID=UPI001CC79C41|nr:outer membrane beta-barrel protein [Ferruginibacter albus]UAY51345.1 porin family protein [Ferruginibacter albus]